MGSGSAARNEVGAKSTAAEVKSPMDTDRDILAPEALNHKSAASKVTWSKARSLPVSPSVSGEKGSAKQEGNFTRNECSTYPLLKASRSSLLWSTTVPERSVVEPGARLEKSK